MSCRYERFYLQRWYYFIQETPQVNHFCLENMLIKTLSYMTVANQPVLILGITHRGSPGDQYSNSGRDGSCGQFARTSDFSERFQIQLNQTYLLMLSSLRNKGSKMTLPPKQQGRKMMQMKMP